MQQPGGGDLGIPSLRMCASHDKRAANHLGEQCPPLAGDFSPCPPSLFSLPLPRTNNNSKKNLHFLALLENYLLHFHTSVLFISRLHCFQVSKIIQIDS